MILHIISSFYMQKHHITERFSLQKYSLKNSLILKIKQFTIEWSFCEVSVHYEIYF